MIDGLHTMLKINILIAIIKYPIFEVAEQSAYRKLPWSDEAKVYDDEEEIPYKKSELESNDNE